MTKVTLTIRADDAEPILRQAAYDAAKYSALCDHITRKTYNAPIGYGQPFDEWKAEWKDKFLTAKRLVESFGVEYEMTSEEEALTVHIPTKGEKYKTRKIGGMVFREVYGGQPDYKNPIPEYRREVHSQACHAAARRTVRKWRAMIEVREAA